MGDRIIDAAKDGYVDLLKFATKRELNSVDEDGMTATMWAAKNGNLEALRLIVGRQGDVNMCDYLGYTPLHHAADTGHFDVVCFLVHYGCNLVALDNDHHSAMDLALMNNRTEIVGFLDSAIAQRKLKNPKQFNKMREDAIRAADTNIKRYEKLQDKAAKRAAIEQNRSSNRKESDGGSSAKPGFFKAISLRMSGQNSLAKSMQPHGKLYSDMAGLTYSGRSGVPRKLQTQRSSDGQSGIQGDTVRSRAAADVVYRTASRGVMPSSIAEEFAASRRPELENVFGDRNIYSRKGNTSDEIDFPEDEDDFDNPQPGLLSRPGFNLGFLPNRNFLKTVESLESATEEDRRLSGDGEEELGGLVDGNKQQNLPFSRDAIGDLDDDDDDEDDDELSTTAMFVISCGLKSYFHKFSQEKIDMQTLMIMSDDDFKQIGLPFGPRKKLTEAIAQRKAALEVPSRMTASAL